MAKEMGLDRAPIEFRKLVFLVPPTPPSPTALNEHLIWGKYVVILLHARYGELCLDPG